MSPVFMHYDQAALDAQYDNRRKVAATADYLRRYAQDSAATRAQWGARARLDVPYGPSPAERLDIFPADAAPPAGAPVLVFIHGGYWHLLDKSDTSYVARGFAPHGITTVVINYALIPAVRIGEIVRQCRAALDWVVANAASFGGDPGRVAVCGHSAGGHLTAMTGAGDPAGGEAAPAGPVVAGYAISGLHDLVPISRCYLQKTLDLSPQEVAANSPAALPAPRSGRWLALVGGAEGPEYLRQSVDLVAHWQSAGERQASLQVAAGHDHFSIAMALADPADPLTRLIADDLLRR